MEIRFISSLTADDESRVAPALLKAVSALMDQLPIAYTLRIQTSGAEVFQHTHTQDAPDAEVGKADESASRFAAAVHSYVWGDRNES